MADQLQFRGGTTAQVNAATVVSRELIIDTSTDQIVSGPSKKKTVMEDANGDVEIGGDIDLGTVGTFSTTLQTVTPTANRTVSIPDATGTIGLVNGPTGSIQFNQAGALNGTSDFSTSLVWNSATTTFTGLKLNVTNTASAADSNLLDLQVGGSPRLVVNSAGKLGSNGSTYDGFIDFGWDTGRVLIGRNDVGSVLAIGKNVDKGMTLASDSSVGWSASGAVNGSNFDGDLKLIRDSANVLAVTDGSTGTGYLKLIPTTVGALTAAATVGAGTKAFVNDANATTFASVVAGGGSNVVPVYSDGTDWRIG